MVTVAFMVGVVALVIALVAFAVMQMIGEHAQNAEEHHHHHRLA